MPELAYPPDLARKLHSVWSKLKHGFIADYPPSPIPIEGVLSDLLGLCYQLSFLKDEGRPLRFRVLLSEQATLNPVISIRSADFVKEMPAHLRSFKKLIPCAPIDRTMIRVGPSSVSSLDEMRIYGLCFDDSSTWDMVEGKAFWGSPFASNDLVISVTGPAALTVSCGPLALLRLREGEVLEASEDVLWSTWLSGIFSAFGTAVREGIISDFATFGSTQSHAQSLTDQMISSVVMNAFRALAFGVKNAGHGGAIAFVPPEFASTGDPDWLTSSIELVREKRSFIEAGIYSILFHSVQQPHGFGPPYWTGEDLDKYFEKPLDYYQFILRLDKPDSILIQAVQRLQRAVANVVALTQVDGLTLLDTNMRLLRYACMIGNIQTNPEYAYRATTATDTSGVQKPLQEFGARHQSMFRLCMKDERILGLVVSQDGDMRLVRRVGEKVLYWDQVGTGQHSP